MIRLLLPFIVTWALFFFGISAFYHLTKTAKASIIRLVMYSLMCAVLAAGALALIVILF